MGTRAVLICFNVKSDKFDSNYERNKFFRGLYGWKQIIKKETKDGDKKYVYEREGLLDEVQHKKVDQSSFFVGMQDAEQIFSFFEDWTDKVIWNTFKVMLEEDIFD